MSTAETIRSIEARCESIYSMKAFVFTAVSLTCFVFALSLPSGRLESAVPLSLALAGGGTVAACAACALVLTTRRFRKIDGALQTSRAETVGLRSAYERLSAIYCRCDASGTVLEASGAFASLVQSDGAGLRGKSLMSLFDQGDINSDLNKMLSAALSGQSVTGVVCEINLPDGPVQIIEANVNVCVNGDGLVESIVLCAWDVTDRERATGALTQQLKDAQSALAQQKLHLQDAKERLGDLTTDAVTQLKNHRAFQERLRIELRRSRAKRSPLSLLCINIDDFKRYNDTYGHSAGDAVLAELAMTLSANLRGSDFAARYGGDDFVVLLPETDYLGALEAAERLHAAVEGAPWQNQAITIGIGASTLSQGGRCRYGLLAEAEASLRSAKQLGRNQVLHIRDLPSPRPQTRWAQPASQSLAA